MVFKGSMPALVTPFRNGKVDDKAFVALVERLAQRLGHLSALRCQAHGLVVHLEIAAVAHEEETRHQLAQFGGADAGADRRRRGTPRP